MTGLAGVDIFLGLLAGPRHGRKGGDVRRVIGMRAADIQPGGSSYPGQCSRCQPYHRCVETNCRDLPDLDVR